MLISMVKQLLTSFNEGQDHVVNHIGNRLEEILGNIPQIPGFSHGRPPYIVDDGERALLLVNKDGSYLRLPPYFVVSEESVNDDFEAIYSLPIAGANGLDLVRFIPANPDFDFPPYIPEQLLSDIEGASTLLDDYLKMTLESTGLSIANSIARLTVSSASTLQPLLLKSGLSFDKLLRTPSGVEIMHMLFIGAVKQLSEDSAIEELKNNLLEGINTKDGKLA